MNLSPLGRYFIRRTSDKGQFFQVNKYGDISNEKELDREIYPWYNLTVEAKELDSSGEWPHLPGNLVFLLSLILQNWHNLSLQVSTGITSSSEAPLAQDAIEPPSPNVHGPAASTSPETLLEGQAPTPD